MFHVWNLDEHGVELSPGKMEVTETDLVLHQRGRPPVRWPLRGLRRYGFDAQLFSFESGRRCPTGSGIYAFKCHRAEGLFNALQECIQNSGAAAAMTTTISSISDQQQQQQQNAPTTLLNNTTVHSGFSTASSNTVPAMDSAGYLEPIALGNLRDAGTRHVDEASRNLQHSYVNSCAQCGQPHPPPCVDVNTNYAKLDDLLKQEAGGKRRDQQHFYVNVFTGGSESQQNQQHSYANLSCPASPDRGTALEEGRQVNYVVLDLDHRSDSSTSVVSPVATATPNGLTATPSQPSSPLWAPEGYATIDFDRTAALSNSANPNALTHDDSIRKTRHNSTAVPVLS